MSNTYKDNQDPIHIKPSHRGEFTDAAMKHHESPEQFARHVLGNPGDYSGHLRKQAQFAVNASKWGH